MRRLITGSRHWPSKQWSTVWEECHEATHLILGDCPTGADLWARRFAEFYQRSHTVHRANWNRYKGNAGPMRNTEMVKDSPEDARGFLVPWETCRGTRDCAGKCIRLKLPTKMVSAK